MKPHIENLLEGLHTEVKTFVSDCGASKDAVDDASRSDLVGRCGSRKAEESSGCNSDGSESVHYDWLITL
jgi:hypothetical protein